MKITEQIVIVLLIVLSACEDMYFSRTQVCIQEGASGCLKWNNTVSLSYYLMTSYYMCFPGSSQVLTQNGVKRMSQLNIGDKILAYDFEQGKVTYAPVTAWLHRDTDSQVEYTKISTESGKIYKASSGHNIAYNNNGTIDFKSADELQNGDELISLGSHQIVRNADQKSQDFGLFSPMTQFGNFYIYPSDQVQNIDSNSSLVLVHCLAQIQSPQKKHIWVHRLMDVFGWIGLNKHTNQIHQNYLHPITHLMRLFGDNHRPIKSTIFTGNDNHLQSLDYGSGSSNSFSSWGNTFSGSSSSYSNYPSSSSYFYPYNGYYSNSYYSNERQRRQQRKVQLVGVFACLMQLISLITSS